MIQAISVRTEIPIITGTNTAAILSTSFCTGAFVPWASLTMRMMEESIVSSPTFSAFTLRNPL